MRLVLASGSPRRRELLTRLGWSFVVARPAIDETPQPAEAAAKYVARLSREKAASIPMLAGDWLLAADTTVAVDGDILGKPADPAEATTMLTRLRGRGHTVYTGVTLQTADGGDPDTTVTATEVVMRHYSDAEIARYIASGDPFDKAGGYAVQHADFQPVAQLEGCYANVMGLPLCIVGTMLSARGLMPPMPVHCRADSGRCEINAAP